MKTIKITFTLCFLFFSMNSCGKQAEGMDAIYEMSIIPTEEAAQVSATRLMAYDEDVSYELMDAKTSVNVTPSTVKSKGLVDFITSKAASAENDGDKKFIRTANLSFNVKDIVAATHALENIVIAKKGFIIQSNISSEIGSNSETRISKDSIQITLHKNLRGILNLRVHYTLLDETLREMALVAEDISYRTVSAQDVTFDMVANKLEQARAKDKSQRVKNISGAGKGYKLEDLLSAEDAIEYARQTADNAYVEELKRDDQIMYSTISINLYQEPIVTYTMRAADKEFSEFRQGFFSKVGSGIVDGWYGLLDVVAVLFSIWPVLLFIAGIVWLIIYMRSRRKNKKAIEGKE